MPGSKFEPHCLAKSLAHRRAPGIFCQMGRGATGSSSEQQDRDPQPLREGRPGAHTGSPCTAGHGGWRFEQTDSQVLKEEMVTDGSKMVLENGRTSLGFSVWFGILGTVRT